MIRTLTLRWLRTPLSILLFAAISPSIFAGNVVVHKAATRHYESINHLGNVLTTVTDKKQITSDSQGNFAGNQPVVQTVSDYTPFGMAMVGREQQAAQTRYGVNGQERDNEVQGASNSYNYGARFLDPRLGRFHAPDPAHYIRPSNSPYQFALNCPIRNIDVGGRYISGDVHTVIADAKAILGGVQGADVFLSLLEVEGDKGRLRKITPQEFRAAYSAVGDNPNAKALIKGYYHMINSKHNYEMIFVQDDELLSERLAHTNIPKDAYGDANGRGLDSFGKSLGMEYNSATSYTIEDESVSYVIINRQAMARQFDWYFIDYTTMAKTEPRDPVTATIRTMFDTFWDHDPYIPRWIEREKEQPGKVRRQYGKTKAKHAAVAMENIARKLRGQPKVYRVGVMNQQERDIPDEMVPFPRTGTVYRNVRFL